MAIYKDIISQLGENLIEYNVGAWALFRDQMAAEINSHYIFSNGIKPDETLLGYSLPYIKATNKVVKGVTPRGKSEFTYFTQEGPKKSLSSKPTLANPEDGLDIKSDYKINLDEGTYERNMNGVPINHMYDENDFFGWTDSKIMPFEGGIGKDLYDSNITTYNNGETLLSKTNRWFQNKSGDYIEKRFKTLISRFCSGGENVDDLKNDIGVQAYSKEYGLSHGRNLLSGDVNDNPNEYKDPYCRVWTWHKQYHKLAEHNIRPFKGNGRILKQEDLSSNYGWSAFRSNATEKFSEGGKRLSEYGVMYDNGGNTNGLVNITPSINGNSTYNDSKNVSVEHCMFSIENLAWKGTYGDWDDETEEYGLSREQKGPLGGRIMWFPPYGLTFNESTTANWQSNDFIGRGEPIYTYANTTRSGSLSFKLLVDHPSILDYWDRRSETGNPNESGTDDIESKEQEMLRFFAGCSVLRAGNLSTFDYTSYEDGNADGININQQNTSKNPNNNNLKLNTEGNRIRFLVFFPNNYTGKTDRGANKIVNPIDYLMNGVGTNKKAINNDYNNSEDFATDVDTIITYNGSQVGGYEMRSNIGISVINVQTTDNHIADVKYKGETVKLVKIVGSQANPSLTGTTTTWNKRRYYYRCDNTEDIENQVLLGDENNGAVSYIDKVSHCFNSTKYKDAIKKLSYGDDDSFCSFSDVYIAINGDTNGVFTNLYNTDNVNKVKSIINGDKGKIKQILTSGYASLQGNNAINDVNKSRNTYLATERNNTVRSWLDKELNKDGSIQFGNLDLKSIFDEEKVNSYMNMNEDPEDSNSESAKLQRFVVVEIIYGDSLTENASETNGNGDVISGVTNSPIVTDNENEDGDSTIVRQSFSRYDGEARFFKKLKENEPFITKLLSERINNFDPVFHSISPEGFNARLTFLQQCTRQGPTISASDTNDMYANNLAFGRPPVCVLRVGDFYNTKIIIRSLNVDFDPFTWDLNEEGIGVMPMIANVTMQFEFIGGSDLGGPIQRLQNATSFNYYANTSVYDNRSEKIKYDNGEYTDFQASLI